MKNKLTSILLALVLVIVFACTGKGDAIGKPSYVHKPGQGPANAAISINGKPITEQELIKEQLLEYVEAKSKVEDILTEAVGNRLLEEEYSAKAKAAGMGTMQFLFEKVLDKNPKVSDSEFNRFAEENQVPKAQIAQYKDKIMAFMKQQKMKTQRDKMIVDLSKKYKVELYYQKADHRVPVNVGAAPTFGKKDAKVTIVEFSDFQCPYCARAAKTVTALKKQFGNKILFAFKHYPLPNHPRARPAAEASMCVNDQSVDKYWKYHDLLFENTANLDDDNLKKLATQAGADEKKFLACLQEKKFAKHVQDDFEYGSQTGVSSTPMFFINGRPIAGAQPIEKFKEMIEEELSGT